MEQEEKPGAPQEKHRNGTEAKAERSGRCQGARRGRVASRTPREGPTVGSGGQARNDVGWKLRWGESLSHRWQQSREAAATRRRGRGRGMRRLERVTMKNPIRQSNFMGK